MTKKRILSEIWGRHSTINFYIYIKTSNRKKFWLKILVDSEYTYIEIEKQLVKEERIKTEPMDRLYEVFNVDRTKNGEVIRFAPLKLEINRHRKN